MVSNVYILTFPEQDAVKIGKANHLESRLTTLTQTWGKLDRDRVWYTEEANVFEVEHDLHKRFREYHKEMPWADGSTEFFSLDVLQHLNTTELRRVPTTLVDKLNQKAKNPEKKMATVHKQIYLQLTSDEYDLLQTIIPDDIDKTLSDSDQVKELLLRAAKAGQ